MAKATVGLVGLAVVAACTVNGKPFNPFGGGSSPNGGGTGGGAGSGGGGSGGGGWGGAANHHAENDTTVVAKCPNGKRYFLGTPDSYSGHRAQAVAVADMNGDGKLDLVTGNPNDRPAAPHLSSVGVMLGGGDNGFADMALYGVGLNDGGPSITEAGVLALGDLDGDGDPDLAFAGRTGADRPQYMVNNGDGTLQEEVSLHVEHGAITAIADFNADGKGDVMVGPYVWLNAGKKNHAKFVGEVKWTDEWPDELAVADYSGDGLPDVAASMTGGVAVYTNDGNGGFGKPAKFTVPEASASYKIATADFNGDGKPDIVQAQSRSLAVLLNTGDGSLSAPAFVEYPSDDSPWDMAAGDLNGDHRADVVFVTPYQGLEIYMNDGKGVLAKPIVIAGGKPNGVAIGDFKNDGVMGVVAVDPTKGDNDESELFVFPAVCR